MIKLDILTPEWSRSLEVDAVFLPGAMGEFEVLVNHAPIISTLVEGKVRWRCGCEEECFEVKGGVVRLEKNEMQICAKI